MVKVLIYIKMLFIFSTPELTRHLWQLKTVACIGVHYVLFYFAVSEKVVIINNNSNNNNTIQCGADTNTQLLTNYAFNLPISKLGANVIKIFFSSLTLEQNKLGPTQSGAHFCVLLYK